MKFDKLWTCFPLCKYIAIIYNIRWFCVSITCFYSNLYLVDMMVKRLHEEKKNLWLLYTMLLCKRQKYLNTVKTVLLLNIFLHVKFQCDNAVFRLVSTLFWVLYTELWSRNNTRRILYILKKLLWILKKGSWYFILRNSLKSIFVQFDINTPHYVTAGDIIIVNILWK